MVFGDAVSKLETYVWILNHISKSFTWSPFTMVNMADGMDHKRVRPTKNDHDIVQHGGRTHQ